MALLSASPLLIGSGAAYVLLCVSTGALGLGFGATVMALNASVEGLSPGREDGAVLTLKALLRLGTALAPLLVALFTALGAWWALPLSMAILATLLIFAVAALRAPLGEAQGPARAQAALPRRFWLYVAAALLYGLVETLCGNWATVYLTAERQLVPRDASFALTAFWLMVTLGRVIFALLEGSLRRRSTSRCRSFLPSSSRSSGVSTALYPGSPPLRRPVSPVPPCCRSASALVAKSLRAGRQCPES
ncbi:MAG: hypothetical protein WAV18_28185 [Roseiarcus sp.]